MTSLALGLIGFGNIGRALVPVLAERLATPLGELAVLVRPGKAPEGHERLSDAVTRRVSEHHSVHESVSTLCAALIRHERALVIECAGHAAVREYASATLAAGLETIVTSVGALADEDLHARLVRAARGSDTRLVIPAGAIGALDVLGALKRSGIESVRYRSRKPPGAWLGTPAETQLDLDALDEPTAFYVGNARIAARDYPRNANVAAALALAGVGFEATEVRLIADPSVKANVHEFDVRAAAGTISVRIEGRVSSDNPKTSLPTVYSLVREILNRLEPLVV